MGVFDRAARFAAQAEPGTVPRRLLAGSGRTLTFRDWYDTRAFPLPRGPDRTADLVALLDDPTAPEHPWLLVAEFQAQIDLDKVDATLEEVAILRCRARHGEDRKGKYKVIAGLVYLRDRCPEGLLDMTLPSGAGTRPALLVWNVAEDSAAQTLEAVANGDTSWGMLFWVPLMAGGGEDAAIGRCKEVVSATVEDCPARGNLAGVALVFAELAGRVPGWTRGLKGFEMTESQVVNEWISQGMAQGELRRQRQNLLEVLSVRFPGATPEEVVRLIDQQESLGLLDDWFRASLRADTFEQFLDVLKR